MRVARRLRVRSGRSSAHDWTPLDRHASIRCAPRAHPEQASSVSSAALSQRMSSAPSGAQVLKQGSAVLILTFDIMRDPCASITDPLGAAVPRQSRDYIDRRRSNATGAVVPLVVPTPRARGTVTPSHAAVAAQGHVLSRSVLPDRDGREGAGGGHGRASTRSTIRRHCHACS